MQRLSPDYILGVDISNHQGIVDMSGWKASGIRFIYAKSSEGITYVDPNFVGNVNRANRAGIPIGAYHFARPSINRALQEAEFFVEHIELTKTNLMPVLDLEDTNYKGTAGDLVTWVREFVNYVKKKTNRQVILYTGKWYADRYKQFNNALSDLPLWYSWYTDPQRAIPPDFGGWTQYTMWQYTDAGSLPGVVGSVDLNYAVSLQALGYQDPPPPLNEDAVNKVVNLLQNIWQIGDDKIKDAAHEAANFLRERAGLPKQ